MTFRTLVRSAAAASIAVACSAGSALAGPVLDRVQAEREVRVCIWPDYYGVTWRNPRTQQLGGIDIDLSAALARDLGVQLQLRGLVVRDADRRPQGRPLRRRDVRRGACCRSAWST